LVAGRAQAADELLPVEGLAPSVLLDHGGEDVLDALVGGEAPAAPLALAAPADHLTGARRARVDDLVVQVAAAGALHARAPIVTRRTWRARARRWCRRSRTSSTSRG